MELTLSQDVLEGWVELFHAIRTYRRSELVDEKGDGSGILAKRPKLVTEDSA